MGKRVCEWGKAVFWEKGGVLGKRECGERGLWGKGSVGNVGKCGKMRESLKVKMKVKVE